MAIWAGLTDKALAWTKYAIQIDSAHTTYFYAYLGWELIQKGEYREALAALVQETDMTDWQANCLRVIAHIRLGEIDEAQKAAKLVVSSFPTTFTAGKWKELNFAADPSTLDRDVADLVKAGLPP